MVVVALVGSATGAKLSGFATSNQPTKLWPMVVCACTVTVAPSACWVAPAGVAVQPLSGTKTYPTLRVRVWVTGGGGGGGVAVLCDPLLPHPTQRTIDEKSRAKAGVRMGP